MASGKIENGKETLVDNVYEQIRRDIVGHVLLPGQKLKTKELSARYGVSETPVKLALNRLCTEHIIDNYPRQGMKVHEFSPDEAGEIFDIRRMMDLYYTKEVIDTVASNRIFQEEMRKNVEEHLENVEKISENASLEQYLENYMYDYKFHELYLKCTGNRKILDVYKSINPFVYSNYVFHRQSREKDVAGVMEHRQMLDAICEKDEQALKIAINTHYHNTKKTIMRVLKVEKLF